MAEAREAAKGVLHAGNGLYTEVQICAEDGTIETIQNPVGGFADRNDLNYAPDICKELSIVWGVRRAGVTLKSVLPRTTAHSGNNITSRSIHQMWRCPVSDNLRYLLAEFVQTDRLVDELVSAQLE
jgi:hypothetical protein